MSHFVRRSGLAVVFAASLIASPGFAEDNTSDLAAFLSGNLIANGQFTDYLTQHTRNLQVVIRGATKGNVLNVVEDASYSDGEKRHWVWKFSKIGEGRYIGHRSDLIGDAKVVAHGDNIDISYRAHVPMKDGSTKDLNFDETFSLTAAGTADYRVKVSLMFVPVAEAHLNIRKLGSSASR